MQTAHTGNAGTAYPLPFLNVVILANGQVHFGKWTGSFWQTDGIILANGLVHFSSVWVFLRHKYVQNLLIGEVFGGLRFRVVKSVLCEVAR